MIDEVWFVVCNILNVIGFVGLYGNCFKLILLLEEEICLIFILMG